MSGNFNPSPQPAPKETFSPADNFRGQPRPEHHLHRESEPLPGNHSTSNDQCESEDPSIWERRRDTGITGVDQGAPNLQDSSFKQNAYNSERPLDVRPTDQGGVAIDGRGDLPEGNANMADKMIGKMQKVTGKIMNKPELHEKGELRESGGKLAVTGEARAPHD